MSKPVLVNLGECDCYTPEALSRQELREASFRRGYQQGVEETIRSWYENIPRPSGLDRWLTALHDWRFLENHHGQFTIPPDARSFQ
jgi:hypothetical protein